MTILKIEGILRNSSDIGAEEIIDDVSCEDGLQMRLLVRLEFIRAVQVDSERGHLKNGSLCVPVLRNELVTLFADDLAGEGEITIEPCSPQTTTVSHHIDLVEPMLLDLALGGNLQDGTVGMATNNLEMMDRLGTAFTASQECANC